MNEKIHLILLKGKDSTKDIEFCKYNQTTHKSDVQFRGQGLYSYSPASVQWLRNPICIAPHVVRIQHEGKNLFEIESIYQFKSNTTVYWKVFFKNGASKLYNYNDLVVNFSCLAQAEAASVLSYLKKVAELSPLRAEDGTKLLPKQLEKIDFIAKGTALAEYLQARSDSQQNPLGPTDAIIFPFGGNASQFQAVRNALTNKISVIQGPPGTGKTQTILNIIANLILRGQTVEVVSNNNSATENILEKMCSGKVQLDFLVASLGKSENKESFIRKQSGRYPAIQSWQISEEQMKQMYADIVSLTSKLAECFRAQEDLALARQEQRALTKEYEHFQAYRASSEFAAKSIRIRRKLSSAQILRILQEIVDFTDREKYPSFWYSMKNLLFIGIPGISMNKLPPSEVLVGLQDTYYRTRQDEQQARIHELQALLDARNADQMMKDLTTISFVYLRAVLHRRYAGRRDRTMFTLEKLWQDPDTFIREYPVVLSTTFSARSSLGKNARFDVIIMDEASQIDIATGVLALSAGKSAVIVGDQMQLPNVLTAEAEQEAAALFSHYRLHPGYNYARNSFLQSVCTVLPQVPQTLLREHYRCHPRIIGFCNQKFYQNRLLVMTEDKNEPDVITVFRTVVGNHKRGRVNQRQIDVLLQDAIPDLLPSPTTEEFGIIAPYADQAVAIREKLPTDNITVATVHKFQGRENDTIILCTTDDEVSTFVDDPNLLNVAISRARKKLCLIVSGNPQKPGSNLSDLIDYIQYNNGQTIDSLIYSVFDLLYTQYTEERQRFLHQHKKISEFDSENIMYATLTTLLREKPSLNLNVITHVPLHQLLRDTTALDSAERTFVLHPASHVDFLLYNTITKKTVLAIEVDGCSFHKNQSRQKERDLMKDAIFRKTQIPLMRFPTNGSGEEERVRKFLEGLENGGV